MAAAARLWLPPPVDTCSSPSSSSGSLSVVATSSSSSSSWPSPPSSSSRFSPLLLVVRGGGRQHASSSSASSRSSLQLHMSGRTSMLLHGRCQKRMLRHGTLCPPPLLRLVTYPRCGVQQPDESRNLKSSSKASKRSGKKVAVEAVGKDAEAAGGGGGGGAASSGASSPALFTSSESPPPLPVTDSYSGSPLMWIGVGVALAVGFSWLSKRVQQAMMQQMMRSVMSQTSTAGGGARGAPAGGMMMPPPPLGGQMPFPFPFPSAPPPPTTSPAAAAASSSSWKMPPPPPSSSMMTPSNTTPSPTPPPPADARSPSPSSSSATDKATPASSSPKKSVFQDVSVDVISEAEAAASRAQDTSKKSFPEVEVLPFNMNTNNSSRGGQNNTTWDSNASSSSSTTQDGEPRTSAFTVEQLEKMMEDPMVQQMIYPYLPEEMRNPETFKWMMQSPEYRRQLEEMLQNMGGGGAWDSRMGDMFKNFDLNSQEVKQQFDQIGMTPQEVVSKIMANPEVAMAFAKPNIQAAILDCSQNPLNIAKYTNDPEVMKVFTQISELFPGLKT